MKALILQETPNEKNDKITLKDIPKPILQKGEALIKILYASLNHRDQWCRIGLYPNIKYDCVLGSDACGIVEAVENPVDNHFLGQKVVINPNVNWGNNSDYPHEHYTILGMPTNGTFAEYMTLPTHRLHKAPAHLSDAQNATLPLGGLTAYRAVITKGEVKKGQNVLITGIGGGVAQLAMLFAKALGANVYVTSGDEQKLQKITEIGISAGVNYKQNDWDKQLQKLVPNGFNAIIDSGGGENFGKLAKMLAMGGNLVVYGGTSGTPSPINLPRLFFTQANIKGTTMGNDYEFAQMISLVEKYKIEPLISSIRPFEQIISAFDEMHAGKQFGKLVIAIQE